MKTEEIQQSDDDLRRRREINQERKDSKIPKPAFGTPDEVFVASTCPTCGKKESIKSVKGFEHVFRHIHCPSCHAAEKLKREQEKLAKKEQRISFHRDSNWLKIEKQYSFLVETNTPAKFPSRTGWAELKAWELTPGNTQKGVLIYGNTGRAKTRAMLLKAKNLIYSTQCIEMSWVRDISFGRILRDAAMSKEGTTPLIEELSNVLLLFWDDLFKMKPSELVETSTLEIFDRRYNNGLPTIITTQLNEENIKSFFASEDKGTAFWRRLVETFEVIDFNQP